MHRTFAIDMLACPNCGGRLRMIATLRRARQPLLSRGSREFATIAVYEGWMQACIEAVNNEWRVPTTHA